MSDFALSTDGRLLAYAEFRGGQSSVFVTRYPDAHGKWQVFESGGQIMRMSTGALRWARDTNELFFVAAADNPQRARVMSAIVSGGDGVTVRPAAALFEADSNDLREGLDVSPDGKTLFTQRAAGAATRRLILIENWFAQFAKERGQ